MVAKREVGHGFKKKEKEKRGERLVHSKLENTTKWNQRPKQMEKIYHVLEDYS